MECAKVIVPCSNKKCRIKVRREDLESHAKKKCPKRIVECKFPLCKYRGTFDSLASHAADSVPEHLLLAVIKVGGLEERIECLQDTVAEMEETLEDLKSKSTRDEAYLISDLEKESDKMEE